MLHPALTSAPEGGFANPDWSAIGLVLAIVGSFLLANSILFRHPRQLVSERLGIKREGLRTIREYIFHRVQVNLGFGFLLAGFGLQLYGHAFPLPVEAERNFPIVWIGLVVVLAVILLSVSWWWSLFAFRQYMRDHFRTHPVDFEANLKLAREVGELFGLASLEDDTVQAYLVRLRREIGGTPPLHGVVPTEPLDADDLEEGLA